MAALGDQTLMTALDNNSLAFMNDVIDTPGLAIGTTTSAVKIANTVHYKIMGKFYSKSTADIAFTATAANNLTAGQEQVWALTLDNAGNGLLLPGGITTGAGTAPLPERPATAILAFTTAVVGSGTAQTVPVTNTNNLVANQSVTVGFGLNAETVTITAIDTVANTVTGVFTNNHFAGELLIWGLCPIGHVRIYCGGSSTFTAGTTALNAASLTTTYTNGFPIHLFQTAQ